MPCDCIVAESITRFSKKEKFKYRWDEVYFQTFCQIAKWSDTNDVLKITSNGEAFAWYVKYHKKREKIKKS